MAAIADEKHPLTAEPRDERDPDEQVRLDDVDVRATMSGDGKRVRLTVTHQDGDRDRYELGGITLNGTPIRTDQPLTLYGVDAVIEWQNGGLGMYPGVDVKVTRDE